MLVNIAWVTLAETKKVTVKYKTSNLRIGRL